MEQYVALAASVPDGVDLVALPAPPACIYCPKYHSDLAGLKLASFRPSLRCSGHEPMLLITVHPCTHAWDGKLVQPADGRSGGRGWTRSGDG